MHTPHPRQPNRPAVAHPKGEAGDDDAPTLGSPNQPLPTAAQEFWGGVRAEIPILLGGIPFGLTYGVLARSAGLSVAMGLAMSSIVFAGSSQFVVAQLWAAATPMPVVVATAAIVNVRHMLYSASLAPYLAPLRPAWKWLLAYLLTDEAYAVAIIRYQTAPKGAPTHWFLLGASLALWVSWQLSTFVGLVIGGSVPAAWGLDFTLALTFIAIVVPTLRNRATLGAALVAGILAVVSWNLPFKLGLLVAAFGGIAAGLWLSREQS